MKLPETGEFVRHHGTLLRTEEVTPPPPPPPEKSFIFERQEAQCELRLNGKQLIKLQTLNDFYGLGTAVKKAIQEMKEYAFDKNIGKDSDLEVVVVKIVSQFKAKPADRENFYDKKYCDFEYIGDSRGEKPLPESIKTIAWSSRGL